MIQLTYKDLDQEHVDHLASEQKIISDEQTFEAKVKRAKARWDGKSGSIQGKHSFVKIKEALISMCVGVEICVYCEQNEATDIEHIYPKRLYPDRTFSWENYVLACGKCNSHHKLDKFKIFNPVNSSMVVDVTPQKDVYIDPGIADGLFINQRIENPMDLLELDIVNQQFLFKEIHPVGTREYEKAKFTKDILGLNIRAGLTVQRRNAFKYFRDRLEKYIAVKNANTLNDLQLAIGDDFGGVNLANPFDIEQVRLRQSIKEDVLSYSHPTVWKEIIRQRDRLPHTNLLLIQADECLTWL